MPEEVAEADRGAVAIHAVEVELILHHPMAAAQLAQHIAAHSLAEIGERFAGIQRVVRAERAERFDERRALVADSLLRYRKRTLGLEVLSPMSERLGVGHRL